ncbi:MAG: ATP-binding protein [Myxococcales bacterium]|nr:ATP-binding protein [Myxococcales bacterium]
MLRTLTLKNIRGFVEAKIDLTPLTVFVGTNGSGKTTVLECVDLLCRASAAAGLSWKQSLKDRLAPERLITFGASQSVLRLATAASTSEMAVSQASASLTPKGNLPRSLILRLAPDRLAAPSYLKDTEPSLATDGDGLASLLDYLIGLRDGSIESIEDELRKVVPQARRLRVVREKIEDEEWVNIDEDPRDVEFRKIKRTHVGSRIELEFGKMGFIPASALSEGTLIALGVLTAVHHGGAPTVVLFDDIDRGLHPTAQIELIKTLRALVGQRDDLQIICTTHSSYALDAFDASEVHVTWMNSDGLAFHRRLDEHPEWPKWKPVMDAGEFWSTVGERWVGDPEEPT